VGILAGKTRIWKLKLKQKAERTLQMREHRENTNENTHDIGKRYTSSEGSTVVIMRKTISFMEAIMNKHFRTAKVRHESQRGSTLVAILLIIIIAVGGILGYKYFVSVETKTAVKTDIADRQRWTDEKIVKNPELYLKYQLDKTAEELDKLEARILAFTRLKSNFENSVTENNNLHARDTQKLDEVKAAYRKAEADNEWPIIMYGQALSQEMSQTTS